MPRQVCERRLLHCQYFFSFEVTVEDARYRTYIDICSVDSQVGHCDPASGRFMPLIPMQELLGVASSTEIDTSRCAARSNVTIIRYIGFDSERSTELSKSDYH